MALDIGSRLGHYQVTALIGEGGMGQVYQATDTKLNRQVALKILPEAFATDPDRLARFQREAQVLASLNHPGIAAIYGIEEQDDTRALVLELVEGPTLADRIAQGPIPIDEALPIAKQIAEALEAAHEAGVIHRDLKPANIKVREDGTVKVLDFGLAKALDPSPTGDPSESPTLTAAATQMGLIMGTAAYMSPEQARGSVVDRRADIWAFGVVLYEMLTGKRLFTGATVSDTLASVLKTDPDWSTLPGDTPAAVRRLLRRCLERDGKERLQHIGDARVELREALVRPAQETPGAEGVAPQAGWWRQLMPYAAGLVVGSIVVGVAMWWGLGGLVPPLARHVTRFPIILPVEESLVGFTRHQIALSPDETHLVYVANNQLYLRPMARMEATPIRGTESAREPFFSADGQRIGFWAQGELKTVAVTGGTPATLGEVQNPWGASWDADDTILFGQGPGGIWRVRLAGGGGTPEVLLAVEEGEQAHVSRAEQN